MEPTIKPGDTIWVDHSFYSSHPIKRLDIVLYEAAANGDPHQGNGTKIVKRVIALGGETVQLIQGKVLINGQELKETFDSIPSAESFGPITVPTGEYFLWETIAITAMTADTGIRQRSKRALSRAR